MSAIGQTVPEAAKLHIRISDSDDESDGEQAAKEENEKHIAPQQIESTDDMSQLAKTAQATAEAVMRVNDAVINTDALSTIASGSMVSCQDKVGAGDNINSVVQQAQVYYIPQVYPCATPPTYTYAQTSVSQTSSAESSQDFIPGHQNSQTWLYQIPQMTGTRIPAVSTVPAGTMVYQMPPPQSPMPSSQIIYQMPTAPQLNYPAIMYQIPNMQSSQQVDNSSQISKQEYEECHFENRHNSGDAGGRGRRSLTIGDFIRSSTPEMIYPTVYVSPAGLLTVLLKHDVAVEMTLDRTIRVVNHKHKSVAATNSKGTASCMYHGLAKVYQDTTRCDAECFLPSRQLSITTESLKFASGLNKCYKLNNKSYEFTIAYPSFRDLSQDMSVSLLFSSKQYGPHLIEAYQEVANTAKYRKHRNGGTTVYINGMKIYQYERGDVAVHSGHRYIRVSPTFGSMMVGTHYVEMLLENTHTVKVRRGDYRFKVTEDLLVMSDGNMECGMDSNHQVFCQLEMLLVRTIIDNRQPCDISCAGSSDAYVLDTNRPRPLPVVTCQTNRPCLLPPPPPFLQQMYERYMRRQTGWWRRRGRSHYTIDLEKAIKLAKDEYEKKKNSTTSQTRTITMKPESIANDKETVMETNCETTRSDEDKKKPNKDDSDSTAVVCLSENVQRLVDERCKTKDDEDKIKGAPSKRVTIASYQESEAAPRLWSSIVISPEKPVGKELHTEAPMNNYSYPNPKERASVRHVTINPTPRVEQYDNRWETCERKVKKMKNQPTEDSRKRINAEREHGVKSTQRQSRFSRTDKESARESTRESTRESRGFRLNEGKHLPEKRNDRGNNTDTRMPTRNHNQHSINRRDNKDVSRNGENRKSNNSNRKTKKREKYGSKTGERHGCTEYHDVTRRSNNMNVVSESSKNEKSSQVTSSAKTERSQQNHIQPPPNTSETKTDNISPREKKSRKMRSPRDKRSPRVSGQKKGQKKRSPRESNRLSPGEKQSDEKYKPRERRNKKKRTSRRYTDMTENKEATYSKVEIKPVSTGDDQNKLHAKKNELSTEELVKVATSLVNHVLAEATKIIKESSNISSETRKSEEEQLEETASTVLKHVFYIVCHKWKMYYSHIHNVQAKVEEDNVQERKEERENGTTIDLELVDADIQLEEEEETKIKNEVHTEERETETELDRMEICVAENNEKSTDLELIDEDIHNIKEEGVNVIKEQVPTDREYETNLKSSDICETENIDNTDFKSVDADVQLEKETDAEIKEQVLIEEHENKVQPKSLQNCETVTIDTKTDLELTDADNLDKELPVTKDEIEGACELTRENYLSSDDETLTEEIVYQVVNTTTSADHLEMMSYSKAADKKLPNGKPKGKKSEPNVRLKESKSLRSTKSEVMTSSTSGSVDLPRGIDAQNNSEGNICCGSAGRIKATQRALSKPEVDINTIDIATNEKGSGESMETATRKIDTATPLESQRI